MVLDVYYIYYSLLVFVFDMVLDIPQNVNTYYFKVVEHSCVCDKIFEILYCFDIILFCKVLCSL